MRDVTPPTTESNVNHPSAIRRVTPSAARRARVRALGDPRHGCVRPFEL
ncbi:MAG: hypothetical protein HY905_00435 [Deltaproteobacteria bacterium]|nr:hypothetical protein [Deltaproteobacteria bacterium]